MRHCIYHLVWLMKLSTACVYIHISWSTNFYLLDTLFSNKAISNKTFINSSFQYRLLCQTQLDFLNTGEFFCFFVSNCCYKYSFFLTINSTKQRETVLFSGERSRWDLHSKFNIVLSNWTILFLSPNLSIFQSKELFCRLSFQSLWL